MQVVDLALTYKNPDKELIRGVFSWSTCVAHIVRGSTSGAMIPERITIVQLQIA